MSEWNRDRGGDMRRDASRDTSSERSSSWRDERWADDRQGGEQRSFGGEGRYDSSEDRNASFGRREYSGPRSEYDDRAARASSPRYGAQQRWSDADQRRAESWRDPERTAEGQQSGPTNAFTARNEVVQHVSDEDYSMWSMFGRGDHGRGEHRGKGPKNYTRSDDRIREDVNDRLTHDSRLDASEIDVQVSQSEVTLTGTVNSREDKRLAEDIVEQVSGVKHVQNNVRVQQPGSQSTATGAAGANMTPR